VDPGAGGRGQQLSRLYRALEDEIAVCDYFAVCDYCADAFGVDDAVDDTDADRLDEYERYPSTRSLVDEGYEIIPF
jgi:hypothetical protein